MRVTCRRSGGLTLALCVGLVCLGVVSNTDLMADELEVVADGLNNPRGLAFGPEGALYVAEAGTGGDGPCIIGGDGGPLCYGPTGAITRIWRGMQTRIVEGLPSLADPEGFGALGPHDISMRGRGEASFVTGLGAEPAARDDLDEGAGVLARLFQLTASGNWRILADLGHYEEVFNPDGGEADTNPYGILAVPGGRLVVDAGGNSLQFVKANGRISTLAVFPDRLVDAPPFLGLPPGTQIPMQAVPTSVVIGPDGAMYVGQLTGFPFPVGGANVYRVVPNQGVEVFASGFTNIIDIAFGNDGSLYVLEITHNGLLSGDPTGALIRMEPDGTRTTLASEGLVMPGGVALGPDGIYVTNYAIFPAVGQVVRITP